MLYKNITDQISYFLVKLLLFLTRVVPLKFSYTLCTFIVFAGSRLRWKRKQIALDNLRIVFPGKTEKERKFIFRESLRKTLKSFFEFAYLVNGKYTSEKVLKMASATGLEFLDDLKERNQGAFLYSGHFGNFALMIIWLAVKGYPIAAIYKEAANLPDDFFGKMLKKLNVTPLKYKSDAALASGILKSLKEGKIVLIQNDQSHPNGIYINFFNKYVPSPAGPVLLAKRAGVPIIPAYICRNKENHHQITILPEIKLQHEDDHEKFIRVNTQILIDWIAEILIKHPAEWYWLHHRWKRAIDQPTPVDL